MTKGTIMTEVCRRTFLQNSAASLATLGLAAASEGTPKRTAVKIGFGAGDITPSPGMGMPGGFFAAKGNGVRDRCWAVACVVDNGSTPLALVGTDTLFIGRTTVEEARKAIQQKTGIPPGNILIGASHTHTGGPVGPAHGSRGDKTYLARVARGITDAVVAAWHERKRRDFGVGTGREDRISFNRRFLMRDGREITHPGKPGTPHHNDIVRPAGPIDPDVGVLAVRDVQNKLAGVVVNFACHNTVMGGRQFSADYVGQLRKHLKRHYGEQTPVVFLLGACGDITQVDNMSRAHEFGPEYADMVGSKLAAEVIRTIDRLAWQSEGAVAVASETAVLSIRPEPDVNRERPAFGLGSGASIEGIYEAGRKEVADLRQMTATVPTEVQAVRVGGLGIVTNGAEYFCEYGLRMKAAAPFSPTWMVTLANDALGYVPTPQGFYAGGYEARTTYWSRFAADTAQRLLEAGLKALGKLGPPDVPQSKSAAQA